MKMVITGHFIYIKIFLHAHILSDGSWLHPFLRGVFAWQIHIYDL